MACETCGTCTPIVKVPALEAGDMIVPPILDEVTDEVVTGNGVFDIYMRAAKAQLDEEYKKTRIKGADYAMACVQLIDKMMSQANQFVLAEFNMKLESQMKVQMFPYQMASLRYETALKQVSVAELMAKTELTCTQTTELVMNGEKDRALKSSQIAVQGAQKLLYERQTIGFDDKRDNDNLKIVTDSWAVQATEMNEAGTSMMNILDVNGNLTLNKVLTSVLPTI